MADLTSSRTGLIPMRGDYFASRRVFLFVLAAPAVLYVIVFGLMPLAQGAWYSLFDYNLQRPNRTTWAGLDNYVRVISEPAARAAIVNTFVFTVVGVTLQLVAGFAIALLLWRDDRFNRFCLAFILIPVTVTPLVVGLVFKAMLGAVK